MKDLLYLEKIKKDIYLTQEQKDILVGTLLGDATFVNYKNVFMINAEIDKLPLVSVKFEQSSIHKDYLFSLFDKFSNISKQVEPKEYIRFDKRYDKKNISYSFSLNKILVLNYYAHLFLVKEVNGLYVKKIPSNIEELLTPCALGSLINDDGQSFKRGGLALCTDNYTLEDTLILKKTLENKFGLICSIHTKENKKRNIVNLNLNPNFVSKIYYRIYISSKSLSVLRSLVIDYVHSSMYYKLKI